MASSSDLQLNSSHSYTSSTWSEATDPLSVSVVTSHCSTCKSQVCASPVTSATGASVATLSYQPFDVCVEVCSEETKECPTESQSKCERGKKSKEDDTRGSSFSSSDRAYAETWNKSGAEIPPRRHVAWLTVSESSSAEESFNECEVEYFPSWIQDAHEETSQQSVAAEPNKERRCAWPGDEPATGSPISSAFSNSINYPDELKVEDLTEESKSSSEPNSVIVKTPGKRDGVPTNLIRSKFLRSTERHSSMKHTAHESTFSNSLKISLEQDNNMSVVKNMAVPFVLECSRNIPWPGRNSKLSRRGRDVAEILPSVRGFPGRKFFRRLRQRGDCREQKHNKNGKIEQFLQEPVMIVDDTFHLSNAKYATPLEIKNNDNHRCGEHDKSTKSEDISCKNYSLETSVLTSESNSLLDTEKVINNLKSIKDGNKHNFETLHDGVHEILLPFKHKSQVFKEIVCVSPDMNTTEKELHTSSDFYPSDNLKNTTSEKSGERKCEPLSAKHKYSNTISSILPSEHGNRNFDESVNLHLSNITKCVDSVVESVLLDEKKLIKFCDISNFGVQLETKQSSENNILGDFRNWEIKQRDSSTSSTKDSLLDSQKSSIQSEPSKKTHDFIVQNSLGFNVFQNSELDSLSHKLAKNLYISSEDDKHTLSYLTNMEGADVSMGDSEWYTVHRELSMKGIRVKTEVIQDTERSSVMDNKLSAKIECDSSFLCDNSDSGFTLGESRNESEDQFSYNVLHSSENQSTQQISGSIPQRNKLNEGKMHIFENLSLNDCDSTLNKCSRIQFEACLGKECSISKNTQKKLNKLTVSMATTNPLHSRKRTRSTTVLFFNHHEPIKKLKRPTSCSFDTERMFAESSYKTSFFHGQLFPNSLYGKNSFPKESGKNQINSGNPKEVNHNITNKNHSDLDFASINCQSPNDKCKKQESYQSNNFVISELIQHVNDSREVRTVNIEQEQLEFSGNKNMDILDIAVSATTQPKEVLSATDSKECRSLADPSTAKRENEECATQSSTCATTSENDSRDGESSRQDTSWFLDLKKISVPVRKSSVSSQQKTGGAENAYQPIPESHERKWRPIARSRRENGSAERQGEASKRGAGAWFLAKDDASSESRSDGAKRRSARWRQETLVRKRVVRRKRKPPGRERSPPPAGDDPSAKPRAARVPILSQPPPSPLLQRQRPRRCAAFGHDAVGRLPRPAPIFRGSGTSSESTSPVRDCAFDGHRNISRQVSRSFLERNYLFPKATIPSSCEKYSRNYKKLQDKTNLLQERRKSGKMRSSKTSSNSGDSYEAIRSRYFLKRSAMRISLLSRDSRLSYRNYGIDFSSTADDSKKLTAGGKAKFGDQIRHSQGKRKISQNVSKSFSEFQTLKKELAARARGFGAQVFQSSFPALPGTCFVPVPILPPRNSWIRRSKNLSFQRSYPLLSPITTASSAKDLATGYTLVQGVCAPNEAHSVLPLESVVPLTLGSVAVPQLVVPVNWKKEIAAAGGVRPPGDKVSSLNTEWLESSRVVPSVSPAVVHVLCIQPVARKRREK